MRKVLLSSLVVAALAAGPAAAQAQTILTPHIGASTAGDAPQSRLTWGGAVGTMGALFGFELDVSHTPRFFGPSGDLGTNSVTTAMGNLIVGPAFSPVTPYVTAGAGLLRTRTGGMADVNQNDLGINLGGGLIVDMGGPVALRTDVRYFRNLDGGDSPDALDFDLGTFNYWRLSAGAAFRF